MVRMDADCGKETVMYVCKSDRIFARINLRANNDTSLTTCFFCAVDSIGSIVFKRLELQMTMGINECHGCCVTRGNNGEPTSTGCDINRLSISSDVSGMN